MADTFIGSLVDTIVELFYKTVTVRMDHYNGQKQLEKARGYAAQISYLLETYKDTLDPSMYSVLFRKHAELVERIELLQPKVQRAFGGVRHVHHARRLKGAFKTHHTRVKNVTDHATLRVVVPAESQETILEFDADSISDQESTLGSSESGSTAGQYYGLAQHPRHHSRVENFITKLLTQIPHRSSTFPTEAHLPVDANSEPKQLLKRASTIHNPMSVPRSRSGRATPTDGEFVFGAPDYEGPDCGAPFQMPCHKQYAAASRLYHYDQPSCT